MDAKLFTCLNGRFVLAPRAAVALSDRGFRYGDGVFESIRVERGAPCLWDEHMTRLGAGLAALAIGFDMMLLEPHAKKLLKKNKAVNGMLRIAVSRGAGSAGYAPSPPGMPPSWAIEWFDGLPEIMAPCRLWLATRPRIPPQCLPTQYKLAQGLSSTLAIIEAREHGCDEGLQLSVDGQISEASSANIFWLRGGTLFTPSLNAGCLNGIMRELVLRLSPLPTRLVREGLNSLQQAEAVFLTNSRVTIWPVASLEPAQLTFDTAHPFLRQLQDLIHDYRQRSLFTARKRWISP